MMQAQMDLLAKLQSDRLLLPVIHPYTPLLPARCLLFELIRVIGDFHQQFYKGLGRNRNLDYLIAVIDVIFEFVSGYRGSSLRLSPTVQQSGLHNKDEL
jgi:hypothetical protein